MVCSIMIYSITYQSAVQQFSSYNIIVNYFILQHIIRQLFHILQQIILQYSITFYSISHYSTLQHIIVPQYSVAQHFIAYHFIVHNNLLYCSIAYILNYCMAYFNEVKKIIAHHITVQYTILYQSIKLYSISYNCYSI